MLLYVLLYINYNFILKFDKHNSIGDFQVQEDEGVPGEYL